MPESTLSMLSFGIVASARLSLRDCASSFLSVPHIAKPNNIARAAKRFGYVYDNYLEPNGIKAYLSLVPDKNYFMADANG